MTRSGNIQYGSLFCHSVLPIIIGGFLYTVGRAPNLLMFKWFKMLGLSSVVAEVRAHINFNKAPDWVTYSLPDGLWMYAFTASIIAVWGSTFDNNNILYLIIPLTLGPGSEVAQYFHIIPGTYDPIDLFFYIGSFALSSTILKIKFIPR